MEAIIPFRARRHLSARKNLESFVSYCRDEISVFGSNLDFESNVWDLTDIVGRASAGGRRSIAFSSWEGSRRGVLTTDWIVEPFLSFAKAYVRHTHGIAPKKGNGSLVAALRAFDAALRSRGLNLPTDADGSVLDLAAQLSVERFEAVTAYGIGVELEKLSKFLVAYELSPSLRPWKNWIPRQADTVRVGPKFDEERAAKMPSEAALHAIPRIFHVATSSEDVVVTALLAVLCAAPDRVKEVLHLPVRCETEELHPKSGERAYGLRWWPVKGGQPMVKWVIPSMSDVVAEAIRRLREQTEPARELARAYELDPTRLVLPKHLQHLHAEQFVSFKDLADILWGDPERYRNVAQFLATEKIKPVVLSVRKQGVVLKADLDAWARSKLPRGFPWLSEELDLRYSDALFVSLRHQLRADFVTILCVLQQIHYTHIHKRISALADMGSTGGQTIFSRHGFFEPDGSQIKVRTHQLRHYLNTLAQAGGMSQLDIALWSGRKDVSQNAVYDHVSARELVGQIRSSVGNGIIGPLARPDPRWLIARDEFARLKIPTAHTTDFGFCVHDYSMLPCTLHRDCLNCRELICVKGDAAKEANIRRQLAEVEELLERANRAQLSGDQGAGRWTVHYKATLARLRELLAILESPAVPLGSFIQLAEQKLESVPAAHQRRIGK